MSQRTLERECPKCDMWVPLHGDLYLNEVMQCPDCLSELEVVTLDPVLLALAPEVEEDWGG